MENFTNLVRDYAFYSSLLGVLGVMTWFLILFVIVLCVYIYTENSYNEVSKTKNIFLCSILSISIISIIVLMFSFSPINSKYISLEYTLDSKNILSCVYVKGNKDCQYNYINGTFNTKK